jgi:hypothetical protein
MPTEGVGHCVQTGALEGRASLDFSEHCESLMLPKAQSAQVSPTHRPAFAPASESVSQFVSLSVSQSVCLSVSLSVCLSVCLFVEKVKACAQFYSTRNGEATHSLNSGPREKLTSEV